MTRGSALIAGGPALDRDRQGRRSSPGDIAGDPSGGVRTAHDALGPVPVPRDAWYGARTARAVATLDAGGPRLGDRPALLRALARVKQSAARANAAAGVLPAEAAEAIDRAAASVAAGRVGAVHFPADLWSGGGGIAVHTNVNEVIAAIADADLDLRGRLDATPSIGPTEVNASQSTADVCHTALRLAVLDALDELDRPLDDVANGIAALTRAAEGVTTLSRTCLQDALAVPASLLPEGAAANLAAARARLAASAEPLGLVTLGGTVVGTGDGAPPAYRAAVVPALARVTGRVLRAEAAPAARLQQATDLDAVTAAIAALSGVLARLARDLRLLAAGPLGGPAELRMPPLVEGSTFFAGKTNPVGAETVLQLDLVVRGHAATVQGAVAAGELHLHTHDLFAGVHLLDAIATTATAARSLGDGCLDGLTVDATRCADLAAGAARRRPDPAAGSDHEPTPSEPPLQPEDRP
ncbi:MAG: lyase family protein [Acidimicrobiales bacterium]